MTTSNDMSYYICLLSCFVVGMTAYNIGYLFAQDKYEITTKFICREEIVYKWTGSYWYKLDQSCKTDEQMKGMQ